MISKQFWILVKMGVNQDNQFNWESKYKTCLSKIPDTLFRRHCFNAQWIASDIASIYMTYVNTELAPILTRSLCHANFSDKYFVCFISKSFLIYSFFQPMPALSTISRPLLSSMCSITPETANVCNSYNRMRVPGIGCWFSHRSNWVSKPLCCRLTLIFTLTSENLSLCTTLLLWLYSHIAHAADILTPTTVVQGVDNHSWGLYCRRCYCIRVCWRRSCRISHFSRCLGQLITVLTKDESPHTGYTFTPWVVSFTSIELYVGGTSILHLIRTTMESHENDSRNPDRTAWQV